MVKQFFIILKNISVQIGNGYLLSKMCKIKVVSKFRQNDIDNGGEGAPISPIYHKLLMKNLILIYLVHL